jgi:hypothetical protein
MFKAACLLIHANFHEKHENEFISILFWSGQKSIFHIANSLYIFIPAKI